MTQESTGPDIVDFAAYRAARRTRNKARNDEVVTDVHFAVTRAGAIVANRPRVADLHVLAVLAWCLDMSSNMLDAYLLTAH